MLTIKDLLVKHLEYTFVAGWQPPLWVSVQGLTAEQAAWKPSPERHSIWQIVRHVMLWKRSVLQAWAGDLPSSAELSEADWKEVSGTQAEWEADLAALWDAHEGMRSQLTAADDEEVQREMRWPQQSGQPLALGLGLTHVFNHDSYHAGQIQYLRALQALPADRFYYAAEEGDRARLGEVLAAHADLLNTPNWEGWTALQFAAYSGRFDAVQLLVERGADVRAASKNGRATTALHLALLNHKSEVAKFLLEHGADLEAIDADGSTPLHAAARAGTPEVIEFLIARGAKVNARRKDGATPLGTATKAGHTAAADILRRHKGVE